jgi:acid phosphatase type 7
LPGSKPSPDFLSKDHKINKSIRLLTISILVIFLSLLLYATSYPEATTAGAAILVGAGDISSCDNDNDEATAKLLDTIPGMVFVLGDNVYIDVTYRDFTDCYHPTWG